MALDSELADKIVELYVNLCGSVTLDVITKNKASIRRLTNQGADWSPSKEFNLHVFSVTVAYGCRALDGLVQEVGARDARAVRSQLIESLIGRMSNKHHITISVFTDHLRIAETSISDDVAKDKLLTIALSVLNTDFSPPADSDKNLFASWYLVKSEFSDAIMNWRRAAEKVGSDAGY